MRLVRRGSWKLTFFEGDDTPQHFNLDEDPHERNDRAGDPACAAVRAALLAEARAGWSGAVIEAELARHAADRKLLAAFAHATRLPERDPDYWSVPPAYNVFPDGGE
jgi:hypothetical protein